MNMQAKVTVVDYGIGNLMSVGRALQQCGAQVTLATDADGIRAAQRLVLPGVGAFSKGMQGLRDRGLVQAIIEHAEQGRPLLGICLGMQMLFSRSTEFGEHAGLGLIDGNVGLLQPRDANCQPLKVPHIGWSHLQRVEGGAPWEGSILAGLRPDAHAYFVHSYTAWPTHDRHRLADTYYGDGRVSAAVRRGNIFGCQFHPEKSSHGGLRIISFEERA
jgi:imidazole glycerol-phosphate synthase subunit HisH